MAVPPHRVVGNFTLRRRGLRFFVTGLKPAACNTPSLLLFPKSLTTFREPFVAFGLRLTPFRGLLLFPQSLSTLRKPYLGRRLQRFVAPPLSTKSYDFAEAFVAFGLRLTPFRGLLLIPKSPTAFREPFPFVVPAPPEGEPRVVVFFSFIMHARTFPVKRTSLASGGMRKTARSGLPAVPAVFIR